MSYGRTVKCCQMFFNRFWAGDTQERFRAIGNNGRLYISTSNLLVIYFTVWPKTLWGENARFSKYP